jgi:hypothetical protein
LFAACPNPAGSSAGGENGEEGNPYYTVTFHVNGGSPEPKQQTVAKSGKATEPAVIKEIEAQDLAGGGLYRNTVESWYTDAGYTTTYDFNTPVTADLDLYAQTVTLEPITLPGSETGSLPEKAFAWINAQTSKPTAYTIALAGNCAMAGVTYSSPNITNENVVITLIGKAPVEISLPSGSTGSLFHISAGSLILDNNITLRGIASNDSPLVRVNGSSAALTLKDGAKITGNTNSSHSGGVGVEGGSFTMEGGEISGNTATSSHGGGVGVEGGEFTMHAGKISGNSADTGGGARVAESDFTMSGGTISGNNAKDSGGGVAVYNGDFTMNGGTISGNTTTDIGGGVAVYDGDFTMSGGKISGNETSQSGGGVFVEDGTFTMHAGEISDNTADSHTGGGVLVHRGEFTMSGGKISGNNAFYSGGVVVGGGSSSRFTMSGGTISGNTAENGGGGIDVGGGIDGSGGEFTMSGGTISGNNATTGGGVVFVAGEFTMSGGTISGNSAKDSGGGVSVYNGEFTMSGGEISGNNAENGGGGMYVGSGDFTMSGGKISGNTTKNGGGVRIESSGEFSMEGGEISGNTAGEKGGGVYVDDENSSFSKTGGTIYGDTDNTHTPNSDENTATSGNTNGHAVYYRAPSGGSNQYYRNATLDTGDNISTDTLPASGTGDNWTKK